MLTARHSWTFTYCPFRYPASLSSLALAQLTGVYTGEFSPATQIRPSPSSSQLICVYTDELPRCSFAWLFVLRSPPLSDSLVSTSREFLQPTCLLSSSVFTLTSFFAVPPPLSRQFLVIFSRPLRCVAVSLTNPSEFSIRTLIRIFQPPAMHTFILNSHVIVSPNMSVLPPSVCLPALRSEDEDEALSSDHKFRIMSPDFPQLPFSLRHIFVDQCLVTLLLMSIFTFAHSPVSTPGSAFLSLSAVYCRQFHLSHCPWYTMGSVPRLIVRVSPLTVLNTGESALLYWSCTGRSRHRVLHRGVVFAVALPESQQGRFFDRGFCRTSSGHH